MWKQQKLTCCWGYCFWVKLIKLFMSNLASLRSELLAEYSEEDNKFWTVRNFYEHHNLPARTLLKSSQGKTRPSLQPLDHPSPTKTTLRHTSSTQLHPVGRNIFNDVQKAKIPGPGSYDEPLRRYSSHCYIKKEEEHVLAKINKRLKKRQLVNECRGPGLYNPEHAFNLSSKSKNPSQGRISEAAFTRAILPNKKIENLYLASTMSSTLYSSPAPAPVAYDLTHAAQSTSNFSKPVTHRMSMTQRSSIAKEDSLPGPGFYAWEKCLEGRKKEDRTKATVQYKFVYGHPS